MKGTLVIYSILKLWIGLLQHDGPKLRNTLRLDLGREHKSRMQCVYFNVWACPANWVDNCRALSTDLDKHGHKWQITESMCYHTHAYVTHTQTNPQPEAEDLRLCSGTWSQSHLGPQILLCSPQSGYILGSTERCSTPPCLPYLPTSVPPNSCVSLLFPYHALKGFPASSALGCDCTSEWWWECVRRQEAR